MSTVITKVEVYSKDFFAGFLDKKEDPVWYALAEMHDLLALEQVEKNDKALEELKFLTNVLIEKRKKEKVTE